MICVLGDVMLDKYTYGKVERINPEAPVPVLNVIKERYTLGERVMLPTTSHL